MHWLVCASDALEQVHFSSLLVFLVAAALQDDEVEDVATEAKDRSDQHDLAIDI